MPDPLSETKNDAPLSDRDRAVLRLLLGSKTCVDGAVMRTIHAILLALASTLYAGLLIYLIRRGSIRRITDNGRVAFVAYAVALFLGFFVIDTLVASWRESNPVCGKD